MLFHPLEYNAVSCLSKDEIFAWKILSKNNELNIQQSDQDNSIGLINKSDYLDKMYNTYEISKTLQNFL